VTQVIPTLDALHILFTKIHPEENGIPFKKSFTRFPKGRIL